MAMTPRDRNILLIGIVAVAGVGAYWWFAWSPTQVTLATLEASVMHLDSSNAKAKKLLAKGKLEDLRAETRRSEQSLELMRQLVPTGNEVPALLDQVSTAARTAGLEVAIVKPEVVYAGAEFDTYRYTISVVGTFHSTASFLAAVGSLTRIMAPVNVQLDINNSPAKNRANTKGGALLTTTFELQTYVARGAPPAAKAGARS